MEEIISALTQPLTDAEKNPKIVKNPRRERLLAPDTEANLHRLFLRSSAIKYADFSSTCNAIATLRQRRETTWKTLKER